MQKNMIRFLINKLQNVKTEICLTCLPSVCQVHSDRQVVRVLYWILKPLGTTCRFLLKCFLCIKRTRLTRSPDSNLDDHMPLGYHHVHPLFSAFSFIRATPLYKAWRRRGLPRWNMYRQRGVLLNCFIGNRNGKWAQLCCLSRCDSRPRAKLLMSFFALPVNTLALKGWILAKFRSFPKNTNIWLSRFSQRSKRDADGKK